MWGVFVWQLKSPHQGCRPSLLHSPLWLERMGPLVAQPAHWAQVVWTAPLEIKLHFHLIDRAVAWLTDWPRLCLPRWYFAAFFFLFWNMWAFFFSLFKKAQSTLNPSAKIKKAFSKNKTDEMMDLWRVFAGMHFEKFLTIDSLGGKRKRRRRRRLPQLWKAPLSLSLQMNCIYTTAQSGLKITCFRLNLSQPASENAPGYVQRDVWRQCPENETDFDIARLA